MSIVTQIEALQSDKSAITNAIEAKGVTVSTGDGFDNFATYIENIDQRKYQASGRVTMTENQLVLEVRNLNFKPKYLSIRTIVPFAVNTSPVYIIINYMIDWTASGTATDYQLGGVIKKEATQAGCWALTSSSQINFVSYDDGFRCSFAFSGGTAPAYYAGGYTYAWTAVG